MLRIDDGDLDGAWQDILACHRLARLEAQGSTLDREARRHHDRRHRGHRRRGDAPSAKALGRPNRQDAGRPGHAAADGHDGGQNRHRRAIHCCSTSSARLPATASASAQLVLSGQPGNESAAESLLNFAGRALVDWNVAASHGQFLLRSAGRGRAKADAGKSAKSPRRHQLVKFYEDVKEGQRSFVSCLVVP